MSQELRARLKAARKKLEFTQAEAARAWGVPVNTLICWENDQRTPAAFSLKMLNSMLDEILEGEGGMTAGKSEKKQRSGSRTRSPAPVRRSAPQVIKNN